MLVMNRLLASSGSPGLVTQQDRRIVRQSQCALPGLRKAKDCRTIGRVMSHSRFSSLHLEHVSTVDRAAEELRRSLFDGDLGPGTPLREVALAEALGVSRSTVREALAILVAEGLVDRVPNK